MIRVLAVFLLATIAAPAATLSGTVTDPSGKPIENARVDHTGGLFAVANVPPSPGEVRTDKDGHFQASPSHRAVMVRKAGYESQRILIDGDAVVNVTLRPMKAATLCKVSPAPKVQSKPANDIDYTATWFLIKTKNGPKGIISGHGGSYSFGPLATTMSGSRRSITR